LKDTTLKVDEPVSARVHQRPPEQDIELFMSGSLLTIGLLGRYQFKEALTSFQPHHAAARRAAESQTALTMLICEEPFNHHTKNPEPPRITRMPPDYLP
jgi:hypothetical protein